MKVLQLVGNVHNMYKTDTLNVYEIHVAWNSMILNIGISV